MHTYIPTDAHIGVIMGKGLIGSRVNEGWRKIKRVESNQKEILFYFSTYILYTADH